MVAGGAAGRRRAGQGSGGARRGRLSCGAAPRSAPSEHDRARQQSGTHPHLPTIRTLNVSGRNVGARRRRCLAPSRSAGRHVWVFSSSVDRARAALGRDVLGHVPLPARLLNDRQRAVAVRAEGVARCPDRTPHRRSPRRWPEWQRLCRLSGSDTAINRLPQTEKSRRFFASMASPDGSSQRAERVPLGHRRLGGVDLDDLAGVLDVDVAPCPFHPPPRTPACLAAAMVPATVPVFASIAVAFFDRPLKVKTRPRHGVVADRIRVLSGRHRPIAFSVFRSKMVTLFAAAVAHEAAVQLRRDRDAVNARRIGDVADHFARVDIDDDDVGRMRDIEPARRAVDGQIVPAAFAADLDLAEEVITGRGSKTRRGQRRTRRAIPAEDTYACRSSRPAAL